MTTSQHYYSAKTCGFYSTDLFDVAAMPADAVEVSQELHAFLFEKQANGFTIQPGINGTPEAVKPADFPTPTSSAMAMLRATRNALLAKLDVASLRNIETGASNDAVLAEKVKLRDITKLVTPTSTVEDIDAIRLSLGS
jgi:hypothetical protein